METRRHPLQRFTSPSRGFSSLIHFAGLSSFAASFKYLFDYPTLINDSYGWHFQYLTIIGLSLATITFALGSLADITMSRTLFRWKNTLSVCSAPIELLISVLYWTIRSIDVRLVRLEFLELGLLPDLSFHAVPAIVLVIDLLFLSPPWAISLPGAMGLSSALALLYWFWVEQCFLHNGYYPYPLFEAVSTPGRMGVFAMSAVLMTGSTLVLMAVYGKLNGYGLYGTKKVRLEPVKK